MRNSNQQSAATLNQIDNTKPNIPKTEATLSGNVNGSFNGGINHIFSWKRVMAGERHKEMRAKINFQMLTPLTPTFQRLRGRIETHFVPDSRVWTESEAFTAQRGGSTTTKPKKMPCTEGKILPNIQVSSTAVNVTNLQNTAAWRDSYISAFYPRQGQAETYYGPDEDQNTKMNPRKLPDANILVLRAVKAIQNDFWRNKEYDAELEEFKGSEVSDREWKSYLPDSAATDGVHVQNLELTINRARKNNSYYTNYRTELQGEDTPLPSMINEGASLLDWLAWEHKADLIRQETLDSQLNTWDIISRIRGSKKLTEGKVQLIGVKEFDINYSAVTQNTYNNNEQIADEFRVMGKQGAYSYTFINVPIYAGFEAVEEGTIIISVHVYADSLFESGWERTLLNVNAEDQYRPELKDLKEDVIYRIESGTEYFSSETGPTVDFKEIYGFKRKFSELFKLPNVLQGDMTNEGYYDYGDTNLASETLLESNGTYQFALKSIERYYSKSQENTFLLDIWKDYTDILINKNLAIPNEAYYDADTMKFICLKGQNQIFYGGEMELKALLPIDQDIIDNFTEYGEH